MAIIMPMNFFIDIDAVIWLVALVLFLIIEGLTVGLVSIWMAGGAIAALIMNMLGLAMPYQALAFFVVTALLLLLMRPVAKRMAASKKVRTNADMVIGQEGVVIEQIDPISGKGQVKVIGQIWSAKPADGKSIFATGRRVEITGIAGVKVLVREKTP